MITAIALKVFGSCLFTFAIFFILGLAFKEIVEKYSIVMTVLGSIFIGCIVVGSSSLLVAGISKIWGF